MEKLIRIIVMTLFFLSFFLFTSCDKINSAYQIIIGNYHYQRGDYQQATVSYLRGLDYGEYKSWLLFNLGNVYLSLGENESAFLIWQKAQKICEDKNLLFKLYYNQGHLNFQIGDFSKAYQLFKQALLLKPGNRRAIVNLELTLDKMQAQQFLNKKKVLSKPQADQDRKSGSQEANSPVLNYLQRKEEQLWSERIQKIQKSVPKDW